MGATIKITTTKLSSDASQIADRISILKDASKQISESINRLNGMWDGNAKQAFVDIVQEDVQSMEEIIIEMSGLLKYDQKAVKEYETCEREIEDLISLIRL